MQASAVQPKPILESTSLSIIDARLARIERILTPLSTVIDAAPAGTAAAVDAFDQWAAREGSQARLQALGRLLERLTDPAVLDMLSAVLEHAPHLPGLVATVADSVDDAAAKASENGLELDDLFQRLGSLVRGLSRLLTVSEVDTAFESGMLTPQAIGILNRLAVAAGRASSSGQTLGLLGVLRAFRDAGVQRAAGFMMAILADFGRALEDGRQAKRLGGGHV